MGSEMCIRDRAVVSRGTTAGGGSGDAVVFTHDARMQWPSIVVMTPEQVSSVRKDVRCPVLVVLGSTGLPGLQGDANDGTTPSWRVVNLPGSHHPHADPETADAVSEAVLSFVSST